jgi:hypothetical protein
MRRVSGDNYMHLRGNLIRHLDCCAEFHRIVRCRVAVSPGDSGFPILSDETTPTCLTCVRSCSTIGDNVDQLVFSIWTSNWSHGKISSCFRSLSIPSFSPGALKTDSCWRTISNVRGFRIPSISSVLMGQTSRCRREPSVQFVRLLST